MGDDSMEIGRYKVLGELGSGAYATVYRVQDRVLGREVALKVMHPALLSDGTFVERFRQEAQAVAGLRHPHIVVVYDYGEYDDRLCLVMDLLHGGSLADLLEAGRLPWKRALAITQQVAGALDYAHERNLVHRDVKPHNILLDEAGRAVLADFGVVRALQSGTVASTMSGGVVGTAAYIPVEIWDGEPATPHTDIYALACVVYEMITGQRLFQGSSLSNTIRRHLRPPEFPEEWPAGVPAGIEKVLGKALAQYPSQRYQSAGAFAQALAALDVAAAERPQKPSRPSRYDEERRDVAEQRLPERPRRTVTMPPAGEGSRGQALRAERAPEPTDGRGGGLPRWALAVGALALTGGLLLLALLVGGGILLSTLNDSDASPPVTAQTTEEPTRVVAGTAEDGAEAEEASEPPSILAGHCAANPASCAGRGNPDAPVTVVEVVDYGCPHCADFNRDTAPLLDEQYVAEGTVLWIVLPYALRETTQPPAEAVLCARDQAAFWAYHEALFELQDGDHSTLPVKVAAAGSREALFSFQQPGGPFGEEALIEVAEALALDVDDFSACISSDEYAAVVEQNVDAARRAGVSAVPTFFINGDVIEGNQPFSVFQEHIEESD